jgi:small subunit ribosomal protein S23
MGGRQIRPARVFQTVTEELNHNILGKKSVPTPPWYNIMQTVPPTETLVRNVTPRLKRPSQKATKPRNIFRPQQIVYPEDRLRQQFYTDHPWELARPRVILESDGKDYQHCDWRRGLKQPNIPLTGESVVQYQMWLRRKNGWPRAKAYDYARHEFYRLRQEEEIEKRVAQEEAKYVGAYFGQTRVDVSHGLEDREFENWKIWAGKETERQEQNRNGDIEDFGLEEEPEVDIEDTEATPEAKAEAAEGKKSP